VTVAVKALAGTSSITPPYSNFPPGDKRTYVSSPGFRQPECPICPEIPQFYMSGKKGDAPSMLK
jgi:hypothetical protein